MARGGRILVRFEYNDKWSLTLDFNLKLMRRNPVIPRRDRGSI